ncbi:Hypothetical predicted protein [Octopus vulgaris]|uniref:Uncharacterized protein n=1 Tax=Octopus vulgaris TaxID=6645 RepID=A0AA36B1U9_OCTVU|nr:Hypothetical predicted protein [Octopus vulgaris]
MRTRSEIIAKSFKKCRIRNAINGAEDDALLEDCDINSGDGELLGFRDEQFSNFVDNAKSISSSFLPVVSSHDITDIKSNTFNIAALC